MRRIARSRAPAKRCLRSDSRCCRMRISCIRPSAGFRPRGDKAAAIKSYETALKLNPKKTAAEIRDHETATAALAVLR